MVTWSETRLEDSEVGLIQLQELRWYDRQAQTQSPNDAQTPKVEVSAVLQLRSPDSLISKLKLKLPGHFFKV